MQTGLDKVLNSLALTAIENGDSQSAIKLFTGYGTDDSGDRIYGGQVMAQAISAAQQSCDSEFKLHSMHSSFLRQGALDKIITYSVDPVRDGRSFLTRNVTALQDNNDGIARPIFSATLSFQKDETGPSHAVAMPEAPAAESLANEEQRIGKFFTQTGLSNDYDWPIDVRFVEPVDLANPQARPPRALVWVKAKGTLLSDDTVHKQMFAYASDNPILLPAFYPHGITPFTPNVMAATLSHSIWIHQAFNADDWLLFDIESDFTGGGRGMGKAKVFDKDGRLVASAIQEGLVRKK